MLCCCGYIKWIFHKKIVLQHHVFTNLRMHKKYFLHLSCKNYHVDRRRESSFKTWKVEIFLTSIVSSSIGFMYIAGICFLGLFLDRYVHYVHLLNIFPANVLRERILLWHLYSTAYINAMDEIISKLILLSYIPSYHMSTKSILYYSPFHEQVYCLN